MLICREAQTQSEALTTGSEPSAEELLSSVEEAVAEAVEATAEAAVVTAKEAAGVPAIAHLVSRDPAGQASSVKAEAGSSTDGPEAISELQAMESIAGSEAASLVDDTTDTWSKAPVTSQPTHIWQRK